MGTRLDLTTHGVEAAFEVVGLTLRPAPDGPGFLPPSADVFLAYDPTFGVWNYACFPKLVIYAGMSRLRYIQSC